MIPIAVSQRVSVIAEYGERRDCLDQIWSVFLRQAGFLPILIPNNPNIARDIIESTPIKGLLLTGGNNLCEYGGDAPERDKTEKFLLNHAMKNKIPLIGICRGMQIIQHHAGVPLVQVVGHVSKKHKILTGNHQREVNSFHNMGAVETSDDLEVIAKAEDGVIEAVRQRNYNIEAVMWHPERCEPFDNLDIVWFKKIFNGDKL